MRAFLANFAIVLTAFCALLLLVAHAAPYISPNIIAIPQFFGIIYPYLLVVNLIITLLWAIKRKWVFLLPLLIILTGFNHLGALFSLNYFEKEIVGETKSLKVVSFNVRLFDLYNWSKNKNTRDNIMEYLRDLNADVICFQEYYDDKTNEFETTSRILKFPKMKFYKIAPTYVAKDLYRFGIATFSKYPIIKSGEITFKNSQNNAIWIDLLISGDTIRVYNIHLQSNHFATDNYEFIQRINNSPTSIEMKHIKGFFSRLNIAYRKRADQSETVAKHIKSTKLPTIVCADLNDTHLSYAYRIVKADFSDAFKKSGFGLGHTFGSLMTSVRIDYIFYDKNFVSTSFQVGQGKLSDHKAIICTFEKLSKPQP
jgi:endonuclease/exonuclease/phosphatase family metal-dependent hydrolase